MRRCRLRVDDERIIHDAAGATVEILAIVATVEADRWPKRVRKSVVREAALSEIKDDLSRYLREAEKGDIVITRHGKPAGVLIGFAPRFLQRVRQARSSRRAGKGTRLEDVD